MHNEESLPHGLPPLLYLDFIQMLIVFLILGLMFLTATSWVSQRHRVTCKLDLEDQWDPLVIKGTIAE